MYRRFRLPLFLTGLGILTLAVLFKDLPTIQDVPLWTFFAVLTGLMVNLSFSLTDDVISPAPTVGLMAYLTLNDEPSAALWCVAIGSLVGGMIWSIRILVTRGLPWNPRRLLLTSLLRTIRLTLSLFTGGWVYSQFNGRLPLDRLNEGDVLPLAWFVAVYSAAYLSILILHVRLRRRRAVRLLKREWQALTAMLLLPLPLALLGAVTYHDLSQIAFNILVLGLFIVAIGVYVISQTQLRYQKQVLELSSLSAVSYAMRNNLDLNALLDVVYQQVTQLLNVSNFTVVLFDAGRNMLHFPLNIQKHQHVHLASREVERGLIEHVLQEKTPLLITDQVARQARAMGLTPPPMPIYSWIGVPLLASDRVLGCIVAYSNHPEQHFTANDLHMLTAISAQAGIAIDNAQLYEQSRTRATQLATLNNVSTILSGTLDAQQVLDLTTSSALAVGVCDAVALYIWWNGIQELPTLARHYGLSESFVSDPPMPLLLDIDDLQRRRQPIIVTDAQTDQRTKPFRQRMIQENKHAWSEFLLRKGDDLFGILVFFYNEPRSFGAEEIELLRNFSNYAALAINNARLYTRTDEALNRRVEQLSALADISRELTSTLNLQGLFQLVLDRALEVTQSRNGMLLLRTENPDAPPSLVAYRGFAPDAFDQVSPMVSYIAQTYQTGFPTSIPDVTQERDYVPLDSQTRAQLNVPIIRREEVLGVISLGSDQPNKYGQDDLSFVTQLATQARIAIDNVRLFRRTEEDRDRLQVILDSMKEGVILINSEGYILLVNPRVKRLLGIDPDEIIGISVGSLLQDASLGLAARLGFRPEVLVNLLENLEDGFWDESSRDGGRITYQVASPAKMRFIDRTDTPIRDAEGRVIGLLMVFSDVTEERELNQAREDLSSMIVHDLRGPLTAITTSLKLLHELAPPEEQFGRTVRQTTDMASRAVRKMLNLVDSLLDISKMESGIISLEREPVELRSLCSSVAEELSPLAEELEVNLQLALPPGLPLLDVDGPKIERVLLNLVDNALKFTPAAGNVIIHACLPGTPNIPDGFIRVEVQDTGPGIPDEFKERLFDRYAQIDGIRGRRRGTGLGLTFCRLSVEAHGGRIWVEDNPRGGTVMVFTLPVANVKKLRASEEH